MSDGGFFGLLALCLIVVGGLIYFFKFQDSRPTYKGYERPTITFKEDPNDPGWFQHDHRPRR